MRTQEWRTFAVSAHGGYRWLEAPIHQRHHGGMLVGEINPGNTGQMVRVSKWLDIRRCHRPALKLSGISFRPRRWSITNEIDPFRNYMIEIIDLYVAYCMAFCR